ncbi:MAG: SWIM zinc finger family protein [Burkholderiales bacterium]|nr:SWIM zinc finger family protein [Anaerolineae bacterium]
MPQWTESFIQTHVTDSNTLHDGRALARAAKWSSLGHDDQAGWGLAQGSGKNPYRVCVAIDDAATKCSCPSRKFPCKHAVGLMFLLATELVAPSNAPPDWVVSWLASREAQRTAPIETKAPDTAAQAKRQAARDAKVQAGIEDLRLWLEDLVRQGLSDERVKAYDFWDKMAARMTDAQISPISKRLRRLGGLPFQKKDDWQSIIADEISRIYTLTEAYQRLDTLPEALAHDVRTALGFPLKQEDVIASFPAVSDVWHIVGQRYEVEDRLQMWRSWLYGVNTQSWAMVLEFAHSTQSFTSPLRHGTWFEGAVTYYPGAFQQRAVISGDRVSLKTITKPTGFNCESIDQILNAYADTLAQNPFLERIPVWMPQAWLNRRDLIDPQGKRLPMSSGVNGVWWQAVAGDDWRPVFGEWNGLEFTLVAVVSDDGWSGMEKDDYV